MTADAMTAIAETEFRETEENFRALPKCIPSIVAAADLMIEGLRRGGKIMFCGNGGSAAESQHFAAELMGRYLRDRRPLPALALTVDTSALTAIGNDYSFDDVFARQLTGIGRAGDVIVGISTSGKSKNVLKAFQVAQTLGIGRVALTGAEGGPMRDCCDVAIQVPASSTNRVQELHLAVGHLLCGFVEDALC
jgi:D-sedoheptulose 7-phosphate isomerase